MEKEFFDFEDWDELDIAICQYYNCRLNKDINQFNKGSEFEMITMDYSRGIITLYKEGDKSYTFPLILSIGEA